MTEPLSKELFRTGIAQAVFGKPMIDCRFFSLVSWCSSSAGGARTGIGWRATSFAVNSEFCLRRFGILQQQRSFERLKEGISKALGDRGTLPRNDQKVVKGQSPKETSHKDRPK